MKVNRIVWIFVIFLVLSTLVIWSSSFGSQGQERIGRSSADATPTPTGIDDRDLSKYGSVHYENDNSSVSEERWFANRRYDNQSWVFKTVSPPAGGVGKITHDPLPPAFPIEGSSLIVAGEVVEG